MSEQLDLGTVQKIMREIGPNCVLIGGWASYIHLGNVDTSHDVDAILNPLGDKQRVSVLINANKTQLVKLKGHLHDAKIDLYIPNSSKIGGMPVEKLLPYSMEKHGVRVLTPEAHLLTKMVCVMDDGRYLSKKRSKDVSEVQGMMRLVHNPATPIAMWVNITGRQDVQPVWEELVNRAGDGLSKKEHQALNGYRQAARQVGSTLSDTYTVDPTSAVMMLPVEKDPSTKMPSLDVVRFGFKNGKPNTVERFGDKGWTDSRAVVAGEGKTYLETARRMHPASRAVTERTAAELGKAAGRCVMCGMPLSNSASMSRGYGPECASKLG